MGKSLVVTNQEMAIMIPPEETIEIASEAAKALKRVVSLKSKPVILNGEQYLEFEDLQLLGQFYGYTVKTGDAEQVDIDGVKGAKARAELIDFRTGEVVGGAEAYCMRDEEHWNTRPKYEWQGEGDNRKRVKVGDEVVPWFQLASMAQTRSGAKALRNRLAWVVVLAGYKPTPAEEMTEGTASEAQKERRTVDKSQHYCHIHNVNFFKKGRMKGYSHPIKGTDQWCNEADITPGPPPGAPEPPLQQEKEKTQPEPLAEAEPPALDLEKLRDDLEYLEGKGLKAWTRASALSYLNTTTGTKSTRISDAAKLLNEAELKTFLAKIAETKKMA